MKNCPDCHYEYAATGIECPECGWPHSIDWLNLTDEEIEKMRTDYIENNDWSINCPKCQQHMTRCQCPDPTVKPFQPPTVETWRPEKTPMPRND